MSQTNLYTTEKLRAMFPRLVNVYKEELTKAYDEFLLSDKFLEARKAVEEEEEYKNSKKRLDSGLELLKEVLETGKDLIKFEKSSIRSIIGIAADRGDNYNGSLDRFRWDLNIPKSDSYNEIVEDLIKQYEAFSIEQLNGLKEQNAIWNLKVAKNFYLEDKNELVAMMQSFPVSSNSDIEQRVRDHFKFNELIFKDDNKRGVAWDIEYDEQPSNIYW